jgi:hypothetical protein
MKAEGSSETMATFCQTTQSHILQDILLSHHCENLKYHMLTLFWRMLELLKEKFLHQNNAVTFSGWGNNNQRNTLLAEQTLVLSPQRVKYFHYHPTQEM